MSSLFAVLFVLTLILGLASIIKPGKNKKTGEPFKRKDMGIGFGIFALILLSLVVMTSPKQKTVTLQQASITKSAQAPTSKPKAPTVTTKQVTETQSIPYTTTDQNDSSLTKGQTKAAQAGQNGE